MGFLFIKIQFGHSTNSTNYTVLILKIWSESNFMKSHEISMKLQKKKKNSKKGYLCYPANKYVFKVKTLFGNCTRTEAYLGHCQTYMVELFCEKN